MPAPQVMQCMEVWGGNQPVENNVVMPGLDAWVYCKPYGASEGGGDVYYVSSCATGRITRLLVADVSGHGATVSEVATGLRQLMRRYVNYLDQSRFVIEMNQQFTAHSQAGIFATAVVSSFFAPTNSLSLCNAGHPPPAWYRASTRTWQFLQPTETMDEGISNIPLGIDHISDYQQFDVDLDVGDLVLCYTDCLPEARQHGGDFLGQDGLLQILQSIAVTEPAKVISQVLRAVGEHFEGNLNADDVTILLFRPNGRTPRSPFHHRVLAPFRLGGAIVRRYFHPEQPIPWPDFSIANLGGAMFARLNRSRGRRRIIKH